MNITMVVSVVTYIQAFHHGLFLLHDMGECRQEDTVYAEMKNNNLCLSTGHGFDLYGKVLCYVT